MVLNSAPLKTERPRIGELLVQEGLITEDNLAEALRMQKEHGGKTVENLIALHHLTVSDFMGFISHQPGVASIELLNYAIPAEVIDLVPAEFAIKHELLPIDKMGSRLTVGMTCPLDEQTIAELEAITGLRVRPLLVSMHDLQVALKNYYKAPDKDPFAMTMDDVPGARHVAPAQVARVESALAFEQVLHLVRRVTSLPALPETVGRVRAAVEDPDSTVAEVAEIISVDPGLAAKCISLANSPAFGFVHRVESIDRAVSLLGMREIYGLVLSTAVIDYFDQKGAFDFRAFWKRSRACANVAHLVAKESGHEERGGAFASGLLHDIGRAVLAHVLPDGYAEVDQTLTDQTLIDEETRVFGVAHPEVGFVLAESWELPPEICETIRLHHNLDQARVAPERVAMVVLAANTVDVHAQLSRGNLDAQAYAASCHEALRILGLSESQLLNMLPRACEAVEQAASE